MQHLRPLAALGLSVLGLAAFPSSARAQTPDLSQTGGAVPGTTTLTLDAGPAAANQFYGIVVSTNEASTPVLPGVTLEVSLDFLHLTFDVPGLFGKLDANGVRVIGVPLNAPSLVGVRFSSQALVGPLFDAPSNLLRTTLAAPGTFADTLSAPTLPMVGGAAVVEADGNVLFAGGTGPVALRYLTDLEEWETAGVSFSVGLLSTSTGLSDGRVLFAGGLDTSGQPTANAAVWDPVADTTTLVAMTTARAGHGATLLADGRVMLTGGFNNVTIDLTAILADPLQILSLFTGLVGTTEFFDPNTMAFASGPTMLEPRALHTATALANGKVLVAGGLTLIPILNVPTVSQTAYTYDPNLGTFTFPSVFNGARLAHSAILQADGSVLLVGGLSLDFTEFLTSGDITKLSVGTRDDVLRFTSSFFGGSFSTVGTLSESRAAAGVGLTPQGKVLIAGGFHLGLSGDLTMLDFGLTRTADLYTQGSGVTPTGDLVTERVQPLITNLPDGTLLITGGATAEVYQP